MHINIELGSSIIQLCFSVIQILKPKCCLTFSKSVEFRSVFIFGEVKYLVHGSVGCTCCIDA